MGNRLYHLFLSLLSFWFQCLGELNVCQHLNRAQTNKEKTLKLAELQKEAFKLINKPHHKHLFFLLDNVWVVDYWRSASAKVVRDRGEELRWKLFQAFPSAVLNHSCFNLLQNLKTLCNLHLAELTQRHLFDICKMKKKTHTRKHTSSRLLNPLQEVRK